jgi:thiamine kinase-like enzyme
MIPTRTGPRRNSDLRHEIRRPLDEWQEPGAAEVSEVVTAFLAAEPQPDRAIRVDRLKRAVYRVHIGSGSEPTLVIKRHTPALAQTDRLVVERWLPAIGFADRCPRLLAAAANREGSCVWHVYEDFGTENLAARRDRSRLAAAVDCLAELHTRAARHPILPEVRWRARDHGMHFFTESVRDAIAVLDRLPTERPGIGCELTDARTRLHDRLSRLLNDWAPRTAITEGIPDTLLHGDLWPKNVFVSVNGDGARARLIDWDHVGAGPFTYDLSTFLYQCSTDERGWILQRYRDAVEHAGWRLPDDTRLNGLFYTAEVARYAHCILWAAMALVNDGAEWGIRDLIDYDGWLERLRPPVPE